MHIYLSIYLSICLSIYLSIYLSLSLYIYISIFLGTNWPPKKVDASTTAPRPSGMLCQVLASPSPLEFFDKTSALFVDGTLEVADPSCDVLHCMYVYMYVCMYIYIYIHIIYIYIYNVYWCIRMYMVYHVFSCDIGDIGVYLIDISQNHLESRTEKKEEHMRRWEWIES